MLVWLAVVAAGLGAAAFLGYGTNVLVPVGLILAVPALLGLLLTPLMGRDWVQALLLLIWTGFASFVSLVGGLNILLLCFLCVPAVGLLFFRGRVVEGFALGALALTATVLGAQKLGSLASPLPGEAIELLMILGIGATLSLVVAAMIAGAEGRAPASLDETPSRARWRSGVSGALCEFDDQNRLTAANAQARALFGLDALSGRPRLADLSDDNGAATLLADTAKAARRGRTGSEVRMALGEGVHADVLISPMDDGGLLLHAVDRSDEEARLEALRRARTVAEREASDKTLFFAGVSHELRTPLNAIIGFSDMMRSRLFGPLPGKYAEYADLIHDSGQYMLDLIGDVLDLSKVEAGRYQLTLDTFDLSDVVRSSAKMIRPASDAADTTLALDLPGDDALLLTADRKAVRQMLLNLLSNAVKFAPKGSRIAVRAAETEQDIVMSVSDQGPGMSEAEIARIGEPFAQGPAGMSSPARGSGLGLSLVRQLAELHGGRLEIDSQPGKGTEARIVLPREAAA